MSVTNVATRFAPSPSGELHLGNARTALFNYLYARKGGGRFVLRVEDTDVERSHEPFVEALVRDLRWLGLTWDEGPDVGGPFAPYRQSGRAAFYDRQFAVLESAGAAYPCYCTHEELEWARQAQRAAGKPSRYAGTCRDLSAQQRTERVASGRRPSLRFRVPAGQVIEWQDIVHGPQRFASDDIGDFVVRRDDGSAAFFFSNALDDADMHISCVLRGEDHLTNTARQLLLLQALSRAAPTYGHLSLLLGADGTPLSKRHGATSVRELQELGYSSLAVCNLLFRLGHSCARNELLSLPEMVSAFDASHLQRAGAHFDPAQLRHWQGLWLHSLDPEQAREWFAPLVPAAVPAEAMDAFVRCVRPNVVLAQDGREWARIILGDDMRMEAAARDAVVATGADFFPKALHCVDAAIAAGTLPTMAQLREATATRGADFFKPIRAALTGRLDGPELGPLLLALGSHRVRERLQHCVGIRAASHQ